MYLFSVSFFLLGLCHWPSIFGVMNSLQKMGIRGDNLQRHKAFQRYDATNDGFLDIDELAHTLKVGRCLLGWKKRTETTFAVEPKILANFDGVFVALHFFLKVAEFMVANLCKWVETH